MGRVRGIDVSKWQGNIDWSKVAKDDVSYVFIRVGNRGLSKGTISLDPYFEKNIKGALENGIKVGIYFFSCAISEQEAIEEANFVLKHIKGYDITMPVVFDFEGFGDANNRNYGMTKGRITDCCIAFQNIIKANGYGCLLYGSEYYLPKKFDFERLTDPIWVAKYASKETPICDEKYKPSISGYDDRIAIWQYASCGRVDGISGNVDMNYMYIDVSTDGDVGASPEQQEETPVKMYKKGVKVQLATNFKSTEFDCKGKGCCTETPIHTKLVEVLQDVRSHFGKAVVVNSGYRCQKHNSSVSGASATSLHMVGYAADIAIKNVHPMRVGRYVEEVFYKKGIKGRIGVYTWDDYYGGFVHVDLRGTNSRAIYTEDNVNCDTVNHFHPNIKRGVNGRVVKVIQRRLKNIGYYEKSIDGVCGSGTEQAIIKFNEVHGRKNDAIWGPLCWGEAFPI